MSSFSLFLLDISFYSSTANITVLTAYLSSVPSEQLDTLPQKFKDALARIAKEGIDMSRMAIVLERQKLSLLNSMETDGAEVLSDVVVAGESSFVISLVGP